VKIKNNYRVENMKQYEVLVLKEMEKQTDLMEKQVDLLEQQKKLLMSLIEGVETIKYHARIHS